ncbi:MAG: hypothetical protein ABI806_09570 [Candidatus Solibacter sp.]
MRTLTETAADHNAAEHRAEWPKFVVKAVIFVALGLLVAEVFWRSLGYMPGKSDYLHFAALRKAADGDRAAVALIGSSRVRYGLSAKSLLQVLPGKHFIQLGILGNGAIPVLADLANDANFVGMAICEINPAQWAEFNPAAKQPEALAYTRPQVSGAYLETWLGEHFREHFSFFSYNLFTELPRIVQHKPIPDPERPDRSVVFHDLGPKINQVLIEGWLRGTDESAARIKGADSARTLRQVRTFVDRIRSRGGDVAFVRMPVDGVLRVHEEKVFPELPRQIGGLRAAGLVTLDFAEMDGHFVCPDGSHLNPESADRFSRLVAEELLKNGFFK